MKTNKSQLEKFVKKAKESECDESDSAFDAALTKLAKQPPAPKPTTKDKPPK